MTAAQPSEGEAGEVSKLADELFSLVQRNQGYAFISDGETFSSKAKFFERINGRYQHTVKSAALIKSFLKKYGQFNPGAHP